MFPGVVARARRFVTGGGFAVAAIDTPGFGDRPKTVDDEAFIASIREVRAAGGQSGRRSPATAPKWRSRPFPMARVRTPSSRQL